jgi:multidrug efflux pump subunit AcrB
MFFRLYGAVLGWALRHRFLTLAAAFGALILTTQLPVSAEFFPLTERDQFAVEVWLPESSSIEETDRITRQVETMIRKCSSYSSEDGQVKERLLNMRTMGGPLWEGMAWLLVSGLSFATVLTLFVVPVLYSLQMKVKRRKQKINLD